MAVGTYQGVAGLAPRLFTLEEETGSHLRPSPPSPPPSVAAVGRRRRPTPRPSASGPVASQLLPPTGVSSGSRQTATRPKARAVRNTSRRPAGSARVWRPPGRRWQPRPRRDRRTPLLSAAAGSVSPASRSPLDAPHPPPPIARCCRARSPSRASRRGCRRAGLPRGQSLPGILSGGARRPPARRAYPRATLHGCRELEAEEVVAVAVEVAKG